MGILRADSALQYVKGVGPRRAELLATLNLRTVGDLLEYFPFRYETDCGEAAIEDVVPGTLVTIRGEVVQVGGRRPTVRCEVDDGTGTCVLRWFNMPYGAHNLFRGATVIATGVAEVFNERLELRQPRIQVFAPDALLTAQPRGPQQVGVYRGNAQVKSALLRRTVQTVLAQAELPVAEFLPPALLARRKLPGRAEAIRQMHRPTGAAALERARRRLAYEELLLMELAMALRRQKRLALQSGMKLHVTPEIDRRIRARFPFPLTPSQDQVVREIAADLQSGRPMTRLLQGDVGSGKTVIALYAALTAVANGRQAAIMAPTEILAGQHFRNIDRYLVDSRVRYVLLRGGMSKRERAAALAAIERGEMDLVVGTQALIQKDVAFNELALVVVDEQHKFGVLQRHEFRTKGPMPHYLVMTATPIPRTLAMTVFGDLDVSIIRRPPPGRGRVITKVVPRQKWDVVMGYVRGRLERGEQAYVVCPQIGGRDEETAPDDPAERGRAGRGRAAVTAEETFRRLTEGPWRGLRVELLHGGLPAARKQAILADFVAGKTRAVVATTVVEVGVDVANATIMVVEQADRYGLSQLHQLRGRVGRGPRDSLCVLLAYESGGLAGERLAVMARTTDGFRIAEADLKLRGPGQLFGTKQHGLPELRVASLVDDFGLLEQARQDAFALIAADPTLARPEHQALRAALRKMFAGKLALIDAA